MPKYTTGELAKLCGVSVRTVQYYDSRGLLTPSELSDGGRRLYSEGDARKLKLICFLKELGLALGSIGEILEADHCAEVIGLLLDQQEKQLREELAGKEQQLENIRSIRQTLKGYETLSAEDLSDIARIMENKKKMRRIYALLLSAGLVLDAIEVLTLLYWIRTGVWQPFAFGMIAVIAAVYGLVRYMHRHLAYICPECHGVFQPTVWAMFIARHTPRTRKLRCPHCGYHGYCVETHADALKES